MDVPFYSSAIGTFLQQYACNDTKAQIFCIKPYENTEYFTISPSYAPERYLRLSSSTDADGRPLVELGDGTVGDSSLFSFQYDSATRDWSVFCKSNSQNCLSISRGDTANSAGLIAQLNINTINQRFILEKVSPRITSSMTYQDNGNFPHTVTDSRGNTTTYSYDTQKGLLTSTTDAKGNVTSYTHDPNNDLVMSVTSGSSTVGYTYQNYGYLQSITSPSGTAYNFIYDEFYQNTEIQVGPQPLSTNKYDGKGRLLKTTYGNGDYIEFVYDDLDRVAEKKYNGAVKVRYRYDKAGKLYESHDLFENTTTRYRYDLSGRILEVKRSDGKLLRYTYDALNRVSKLTTSANGTTFSTEYLYGDANMGQTPSLIYGVKENGTQTLSYAYDELVRLKERTLDATANDFTTEYGYLEGAGATDTTTLIKTVKNGNDTLSYTYDELGNITSVSKNGVLVESYEYDSLNQLTKVIRGNDTWEYTYDNGGNLLSVKKNGAVENSYTYGNTNWKDLLTAFNGQSITYDEIGNPLQYRDGMQFTWANGRRLSSVAKGTDSIAYTYNADGLRTSKTVNGTTTTYHWLEGVLLGQTSGNNTILFLYDENGSAYGFTLNGTYYYYIFNVQGDVIGILDSNGTQVVSYDYDAWGNLLAVTGDTTLGNLNPLRYRGYYYDTETGFYYLQSRYYDPVTQRFINADGVISGVGGKILGYNLFAYCFNNPVNMSDSSGCWALWKAFAKAAVAALTVAVVAATVVVAAPVLASVGVSSAVVVGATALAQAAFATAGVAATAAIVTGVTSEVSTTISRNEENKQTKSYSVYFLEDQTGTVQYVGRVTDEGYDSRMNHHYATRNLVPAQRISGLSYEEARGLEEIGMIQCHTLNSQNPINNQIHGISSRNRNGERYMNAACNYLFNRAEDWVLNIFE